MYLKRIKKRQDDKCWFCRGRNRMTGRTFSSTAPTPRLGQHGEGKAPESVRVLLSNPRLERRLLRFPELSRVGRRRRGPGRRAGPVDSVGNGGMGSCPEHQIDYLSPMPFLRITRVCSGELIPRVLRTAHCRGRRIYFVVVNDRGPLTGSICLFLGASYISLRDESF
jgi:hypothetical protein